MPIPEAARSKACVCGLSLAATAGSNPAGDMDICEYFVLCVGGPITRPEESYREWCVIAIEEPHRGGIVPLGLSLTN